MSSAYPLSNPLRRMRALTAALGVLSELDSAHVLRGYTVDVCSYNKLPLVSIWASPETIEWYAEPPQRNLTRTIRGVEVSTIQNQAECLRIQAAREEDRQFRTYDVDEWQAGHSACEAVAPFDKTDTVSWVAGWRAADDELHGKTEATS